LLLTTIIALFLYYRFGRVMFGPGLALVVHPGWVRCRHFAWKRTAQETLTLLKEALAGGAGSIGE